jgi:protein-L-isoaspartate O-methyltransferase
MKLTIGMACFNNPAEVWFTIQSLRMHQNLAKHPDVEILVIDNSANTKIKKFIEGWCQPVARYVEYTERKGTSAPRDEIFKQAKGEWVLVIDSHVMLPLGTIRRFLTWIDQNPGCNDLIHGPMLYDNLTGQLDAMNNEWRDNMWGTWRAGNTQIEDPPYEIPMHGLGLFACRKESWLGFHPESKGFGGEEGYIHEKFRKAGRKVLCLPALRWVHKFKEGDDIPYPCHLDDRIRNYILEFEELGLDNTVIFDHFGEEAVLRAYPEAKRIAWVEQRKIWALDKSCSIPKFDKIYEDTPWELSYATKTLGFVLPGLLLSVGAKSVLEIGIGDGFLSYLIGRTLASTGGTLVSCDIDQWRCDKAKSFTTGLPIKHTTICSDSRNTDFSAYLPFDAVIVDGDHSYEACSSDLKLAEFLLNGKGLIVAHDYDEVQNPGVFKAVNEFVGRTGWSKLVISANNDSVDYPTAILQRL